MFAFVELVSCFDCVILEAPNTCISHLKIKAAVLGCHARQPCLKMPVADLGATEISVTVRTYLVKYRQVCEDTQKLKVVQSKASYLYSLCSRQQ